MDDSKKTEKDDIFDDVDTSYSESSDKVNEEKSLHKPSPFLWLYDNISILGLQTYRYFKKSVLKFILLLCLPFKFLISLIIFIVKYFIDFIKRAISNTAKEAGFLFNDIKVVFLLLKQNKEANENQKEKTFSLIRKFSKTTFRKHSDFIKRTLSYALPLVMLLVLLSVINSYSDLNFALDVTYNGIHIGYIKNENVFRHAEDILEQRLEIGNQDTDNALDLMPEYKIAVVDVNEMSDANQICEQLITNSDSGLTTACGVYVDNKFIGSVMNEADASSVFKEYISNYCKANGINEDNPTVLVDLLEKVTYVEGLYSRSTLIDSLELNNYINQGTKSEIKQVTVKRKTSVDDFCKSYGITREQLISLNSSLSDSNDVPSDTVVNIISNIPFLNVTISNTITSVKEINYKTVEIKTDTLYQGVTKVISDGEKGEKTVTTLETYLGSKKLSTKEISSKITKEPVDKKVYVGTKPVPNNVSVYGADSGAFIWPVVNIKTVTSGFGYRYIFGGSSFHRGIDISGPGANGQPIIASASGIVEKVTSGSTGYGYCVLIDHGNGIKTRYAHCQAGSICVRVGQSVVQGQMIARVGNTGNSTGPHLHFEIIYNGSYANPLDYLTR